jgi:hypothetical protein
LILNEVGTSDLYTNSWVFARGSSIYVTYKYSADGPDNENGSNTNHVREIRSYGPTYAFPQDSWSWTVCPPGTPYPNPGIASTNIVEPDFGYLKVNASAPVGGNIPISWLGRPGVVLQSSSTLPGSWSVVSGTDAAQTNNATNIGGSHFFRLLKN